MISPRLILIASSTRSRVSLSTAPSRLISRILSTDANLIEKCDGDNRESGEPIRRKQHVHGIQRESNSRGDGRDNREAGDPVRHVVLND